MDSYKQSLLNEYSETINQRGMGIEKLWDLRNRMLEEVEKDYQETALLGLDEFGQHRGDYGYGKAFNPDVDDLPYERIQDVKQEMAKLKSIMIDPSSTVEGAQKIMSDMSTYAGRELSIEETLNLVRLLGKAEKKGIKSTTKAQKGDEIKKQVKSAKEMMYGKTSFADIIAMIEGKGILTPNEIEEIAEQISSQYAEDVGLGKKDKPKPIVTPTPHIRSESGFESETSYSINVDSPYKFETEKTNNVTPKEKTNNTNSKDKKVKVKSISINRNTVNNRKTSSVKVTNKKVRLSENSVHKSRGKRPHTTKSKTRRDY